MKNKMVRLMILAGSMLVMSGCASLGPQFQAVNAVPSGKSLVYIYRTPKFAGSGVSFKIHHNDKVVTTLYSGGYYPYITSPGEVEIWAKTESKASVTLDLKAGETKYVKGDVGVGFFVGRPKLIVVDNGTGAKEITACKLIPEAAAQASNAQ